MILTACGNSLREAIYVFGMDVVKRFLDVNSLPHPLFYRYSEAFNAPERAKRYLERVKEGPLVGTRTGLYVPSRWSDPCIFVNVSVTALPVNDPGAQRWSWPCWKTDRTAIGVLAHECGHYIEDIKQLGKFESTWREIIKGKKVTSYEPVPSEAWAETMRLFILNPDLLKLAIPKRYKFISETINLIPSEVRHWKDVLLQHPSYVYAGEKWISK